MTNDWKKMTSTVSLQMRKKWGIWESIREIVQNTLDAVERMPQVKVEKDVVVISDDYEAGMSLRQFMLLGVSEKLDDNARGKYGEGCKYACCILKREGYKITVKSRDWECRLEVAEAFGEPVLQYVYREGLVPILGTKYIIGGIDIAVVQKYIEERFLPDNVETIVDNDGYGKIIINPKYAGKIYNRRIYVNKTPKGSLYGWDMFRINLNPNRDYGDARQVMKETGNLLDYVRDHEHIERLLSALQRDTFESDCHNPIFNEQWKIVFYEVYGETAVPSEDAGKRQAVSYRGGKLVVFQSYEIVKGLSTCDVENANQFIARKAEEIRTLKGKKYHELSKKKQSIIKRAWEILEQTNIFRTNWETLQNILEIFVKGDSGTIGYHDGNKIGIATCQLESIPNCLETLAHELMHRDFGADDCSKYFQELLGDLNSALARLIVAKDGVKFEARLLIDSNGNKHIQVPPKHKDKLDGVYYKVNLKGVGT